MTEFFTSKIWAITGRLVDISRREATKQLKERGAKVLGSVTGSTDYLVSGGYDPAAESWSLSNKEKKARQLGIPIFNEPQLLAILRGETPSDVDDLGQASPTSTPTTDKTSHPTSPAPSSTRSMCRGMASEPTSNGSSTRATDLP